MSNYIDTIGFNSWKSGNVDAKRHLQDHGGERCVVRNRAGQIVAKARRGKDGKPYSVTIK